MTKAFSARLEAFKLLHRYEANPKAHGEKSNRLIHDVLSHATGSAADRALFTTLVYGVLRHWFTLEALLQQLSRFPWKKLSPETRTFLKLGLFQLRYLDQIPDYAAVNTTLELAKQQKLSTKSVAFLNGVLRSYQRQPEHLQDDWALMAGLPAWIAKRLLQSYSIKQLQAMAAILQTPAPLSLRINTMKTSIETYHQRLQAAGITFQVPEPQDLPESLVLEGFYGSPTGLPGYAEGAFTVQDVSSALVSHWLDPKPGETVVDLCAAPGSKTTHLAARMSNRGEIFAVDMSASRLQTLGENLERLGVCNVKTVQSDALAFSIPDDRVADRVLVDAPCSGLGTLRRHPEILIHQSEKHLAQYPALQQSLLEKGWSLLRPGGTLVYSTCSILPSENTEVVHTFLAQHPEAILQAESQRLIAPHSDGFYLAKLQKEPRRDLI